MGNCPTGRVAAGRAAESLPTALDHEGQATGPDMALGLHITRCRLFHTVRPQGKGRT